MNASGSKPTLSDFKTASFAKQYIVYRNLNVLKNDFAMAVRGIVVAKDIQGTFDGDASSVARYDDH